MAHLPNKSIIISNVIEWMIPAMGVRAPFLILTAVRAMAPVAGIPPKRGVTKFAIPCATNSVFERCLPPVIPSATSVEISDWIAPSNAIVKAGLIYSLSELHSNWGRWKLIVWGVSPRKDWMVWTGSLSNVTAKVTRMTAKNAPGTFLIILPP